MLVPTSEAVREEVRSSIDLQSEVNDCQGSVCKTWTDLVALSMTSLLWVEFEERDSVMVQQKICDCGSATVWCVKCVQCLSSIFEMQS